MKAKFMAYVIQSTNPEKQKKLEQLRELMDKADQLTDEILEGEQGAVKISNPQSLTALKNATHNLPCAFTFSEQPQSSEA